MKSPQQKTWQTRLSTFIPSLIIALIGFWVTYQFVEPPPPKRIVISTGSDSGAYYQVAQQYRQILGEKGIELVILTSAGSAENLKRLRDPESDVDLALVQGGVEDPEKYEGLEALASLFYEPLRYFSLPRH